MSECFKSFTYDDGGYVSISNDPNDSNYNLTHCRGLTTDDVTSGYACFGIKGQAIFHDKDLGFILPLRGDLRAASDKIFEKADLKQKPFLTQEDSYSCSAAQENIENISTHMLLIMDYYRLCTW